MSLSSSRPLSHIPLETQAHILRYCDVLTLAVSSRVCLAWLELAGPVLYEHITVRGKEQLEMMIRSETTLPSVAAFVSLDQTRSFTYALSGDADENPADVSQRITSSPVHVERLVIDLREVTFHPLSSVDVDVLLSSFNPTRFHLLAMPTRDDRLSEFTFVNSLTHDVLTSIGFVVDRSPLLDLVLDVVRPGLGCHGLVDTLDFIWADLCRPQPMGAIGRPAFGNVQVWVCDEEEVALAKTRLVGCSCTSLDVGIKQPVDA